MQSARVRRKKMVYRRRKYIVLFGTQPLMLDRIAEQIGALLRCFERRGDCPGKENQGSRVKDQKWRNHLRRCFLAFDL